MEEDEEVANEEMDVDEVVLGVPYSNKEDGVHEFAVEGGAKSVLRACNILRAPPPSSFSFMSFERVNKELLRCLESFRPPLALGALS